jgi:hypothetical protein
VELLSRIVNIKQFPAKNNNKNSFFLSGLKFVLYVGPMNNNKNNNKKCTEIYSRINIFLISNVCFLIVLKHLFIYMNFSKKLRHVIKYSNYQLQKINQIHYYYYWVIFFPLFVELFLKRL